MEPITPSWRHQTAGVEFALDLPGAIFAVGLGAGKSKMALDLIRCRGHMRILVVTPLAVCEAWVKQVKLHAPDMRIRVLAGSVKQKQQMARVWLSEYSPHPKLVVINYESLWRNPFGNWAISADFECVIYDEAHKLKSPGSKVSFFARRFRQYVPHRVGLTGTVLPNGPMDAYGLTRAIDPVFGNSFVAFRSIYAVMGGWQGKQILGYQNQTQFREKLAPIMFMVGREVLDLPPVMHVERPVTLPPEARTVYNDVKRQFVADVRDGTITTQNALVRALRLHQLAAGDLPLDGGSTRELHDAKKRALSDVLEEMGDEPIVVFCRFVRDLDRIHVAARELGLTSLELSGRKKELERWQAGDAQVLATQIQAGGVGVDMTRAAYVVYLTVGFSLADYEQSLARSHRPGQERPVTYVHVIAQRTIDQQIYRALKKKRHVIDEILRDPEDDASA
jgi:SNF2 family DNA or RNA helicase